MPVRGEGHRLEAGALNLRERQTHIVTSAHRVSDAVLEMLPFRLIPRALQLLAKPQDHLPTTLLQELDQFRVPFLRLFGA